jgi:hypothetical protein
MARVEIATQQDLDDLPAPSGGGATGPDGHPVVVSGMVGQLHIPRPRPDIVLTGSYVDSLLQPSGLDELRLLTEDGVLLRSNINGYGDPVEPGATVVKGRARPKFTPVATQGAPSLPLELPTDEWEIVVHATPPADMATTGYHVWRFLSSLLLIRLQATGTGTLIAEINFNESGLNPAGPNNLITATMNLVAGTDLPPGVEKTITVSWKASTGRLTIMLGNNVKTAQSAAVINPAWLKRPIWADPKQSGAFLLGHGQTSGGTYTGLAVELQRASRYARTYDTSELRPKPGLIVDTTVEQGVFKRNLGGVVIHYTGRSRNEAAEVPYAAIRDAQLQAVADIGCPLVRTAESNERVTATLSTPSFAGRSITAIDTSDLVAHWRRFLDRGIPKAIWMIGYCPVEFGGGTAGLGLKLPVIAGWTRAQADTFFAEYWSALLTDFKARLLALPGNYTLANHLHALTFWNEPSNFLTDGSTATQLADTWQACATKLATDHPDLPRLGGVDGIYSPNNVGEEEDFNRAVIDRAQSIGHKLGSVVVHGYAGNNPTVLAEYSEVGITRYANAHGQVHGVGSTQYLFGVTEWGMITSAAGGSASYNVLAQENPQRQEGLWMAAYVHTAFATMYDSGVDLATFFRLGRQATYGQEVMMALLGNESPPRPWPAFGALELFLKHSGNRVSAISNWPNLRVLASKTVGGVITLTYSQFRMQHPKQPTMVDLAITGMPAGAYTFKHWRVDEADGRPALFQEGSQLPHSMTVPALCVGAIQITPEA